MNITRLFLVLPLMLFLTNLSYGQGIPDMIYYKWNNGTATTVNNEASLPVGTNPATIVAPHTQGGAGQFGGAMLGGGAGGATNTGYNTNITGDWTLSFWVDFGSVAGTFQYIFGDNSAGNWRIFANGAAGVGNIVMAKTGFTNTVAFGVADGNPHVVHYVYEVAAGNLKAYVDGVLNNTIAQGVSPITAGAGLKVGGNNTGALLAGAKMDEFRLYSRALTASEIQQVWDKQLPLVNGPNDAGVSSIISPGNNCTGTYNVEVEISNYGTNQINSMQVNWSINGIGQAPYSYSQLLDTMNGSGQYKDTILLGTVTLPGGVTTNIEAWTSLPNGVADTITYNDDFLKGVAGYNYPVLNFGPNQTVCPGISVILDAGLGRDSIRWSNNSTAQTLTVSTPGLYYASVYELGCKTTDSVTIGNYPPPPAVDLGPDTMICDGTSLLLDATAPGVGYTWNDGSTAPTKSVTAAGTYSVTLTDGNGCESSDQILVGVHPEPSVILTVSPGSSICFGVPYTFTAIPKTNGSIAYQWKVNGVNVGGQTTSNQFTDSIGYGDTVSVDLITDICALAPYAVPSNKIGMQINPPPRNINGPDTVIENTSATYAVPLSTNSNFLWAANGGSISNPGGNIVTVTWGAANPNGSIICTETDNKSCSYQNVQKVVIVSIVGINETGEQLTMGYAYPNPANDLVTIPLAGKGNWSIDLGVYDVAGKKVKSVYTGAFTGSREITFKTDDLESGLYFYKIVTSDGHEMVRKLTIKR